MKGTVRPMANRLSLLLLTLSLMLLAPSCAWIKSLAGTGDTVPTPSAQIHWSQGLMHRADGMLDDAAMELEQAIQIDPNMYHAYYQLGLVYQAQGQDEKAQLTWESGLQRARTGPERTDHSRLNSLAQMQSSLAALEESRRTKPAPRESALTGKSKKMGRKSAARSKAKKSGSYAVLYSSSMQLKYARRDAAKLKSMRYPVMVRTAKVRGKEFHRVWVGCCTSRSGAQSLARSMRKKGVGKQLTVMEPSRR